MGGPFNHHQFRSTADAGAQRLGSRQRDRRVQTAMDDQRGRSGSRLAPRVACHQEAVAEYHRQAVAAGVVKTDALVVELGEGHEETPVRLKPPKTSHGFFRLVEYANCAALEQGRNATMERVV